MSGSRTLWVQTDRIARGSSAKGARRSAGTCPPAHGRVARCRRAGDTRRARRARRARTPRSIFNMGHPGMMIEAGGEPKPGDGVRLSHGLRGGDLAFGMPALKMHVHVQLEERQYVFPMHLDQIGIVAGEGRVFFSLRCVFEYRIRKEERRTVTLYDGAAPAEIPGSYRVVHERG
nr:DUF2169 domain-containing protein [Sorangium cellulosum]